MASDAIGEALVLLRSMVIAKEPMSDQATQKYLAAIAALDAAQPPSDTIPCIEIVCDSCGADFLTRSAADAFCYGCERTLCQSCTDAFGHIQGGAHGTGDPAEIASSDDLAELADAKGAKDAAYRERNCLVAALSKLLPAYMARHPDEDKEWEDDWRWIVFIESPRGQLSWHIHDSELPLFEHMEQVDDGQWDGHTTEEKYARLAGLRCRPAYPRDAEGDAELLEGMDRWPPLREFVTRMIGKLDANAHKPGWREDDPMALLLRVAQERDESLMALVEGDTNALGDECADVANMAMMVWDAAEARALRERLEKQA